MAGAEAELPQEHTFRLSRKAPVVTFVILMLVGVGLVFMAGREFPLAGTGWETAVRLVAAVCCVVLGLPLARAYCRPMPRSVRLDADGAHINWPGRQDDWPWESLSWRSDQFGEQHLAPEGERSGLPHSFIEWRDHRLFWGMVFHYLEEPLGRREAQRLAEGEPMRMAPHGRRMMLAVMLGFWGYAGLKSGVLLSMVIHSWDRLPPQMAQHFQLWYAVMAVVFLPLVGWRVWRDMRQSWFAIRFLPDGIEEKWPGGRRFIPFGHIDRVTYQRKGPRGNWLIVRAGKQSLKLASGMPLFFGARELLKRRAVCAVWNETGS